MNRSRWLASLPNLITVGRLFLVPVIIELILEQRWFAVFVMFTAAGLSDAVDGFIARQFDLRSDLGAYLDPLADKALLVSIFIALAATGVTPHWFAILVVSRDVMIVGAVLVAGLLGNPMAIRPLFVSKATTTAQIVLAAVLLGSRAFAIDVHMLAPPLLWGVAALTVASATAYLAGWLDHMGG